MGECVGEWVGEWVIVSVIAGMSSDDSFQTRPSSVCDV